MGSNITRHLTLFSLCIFLFSGSSFAQEPTLEDRNQQSISLQNQKEKRFFSPSEYFTRLDAIPIVNPTTPGTTTPTPTLTPTPVVTPTSPSAPISGGLGTNPTTGPGNSGGGSWCIASSAASPTALQVALDYACGYGGADCSAVQPGGSCYEPNTLKDHASYAFNDYYQKNPSATSCVFGGTAQLTSADPSSGNCHYATPRATPSITPPAPVNPTPPPPTVTTPTTIPTPTPPTTTTPDMGTPTDSSNYGSEPTAMPNSATSISNRSLLLLTMTYLMGLLVANHL